MNNPLPDFSIELPFKVPEVDEKYLPVAYGIMGIGLLLIVKKPTTILSIVSSYFTFRNLIAEGKIRLKS